MKFETFSQKDGLPGVTVSTVIQDGDGILWIGTWDGLYSNDGYDIKGFWNDPNDTTSLANNWVEELVLGNDGELWIGTQGGGLDVFDKNTFVFRHFPHDSTNKKSISHNVINSLYKDSSNRLWVGTSNGLSVMDLKTESIQRIPMKTEDHDGIVGNSVASIYEDEEGKIWVGTGNLFMEESIGALNVYDSRNQSFKNFQADANEHSRSNHVYAIHSLDEESLLISSWNGNLYRFIRASGKFTPYLDLSSFLQLEKEQQLFAVLDIDKVEGEEKFIFSTFYGGLLLFDKTSHKIIQYNVDKTDPYSLKDNRVWNCYEDREGQYWVGGFNGLAKFRLNNRMLQVGLHASTDLQESNEWVTAATEGTDGTIYLATSNNQIYHWDRQADHFEIFQIPNSDCNAWQFPGPSIAGYEGGFWVVSSCGIFNFNGQSGEFKRINHQVDQKQLTSDNPIHIIPVEHGFWMNAEPTPVGIFENDSLISFDHSFRLANTDVECILQDSNNNIWIGTSEGINRWDPVTNVMSTYLHDGGGQSPPAITGMQLGTDRKLWVSSDTYGIGTFDMASEKLKKYSIKEGLHSSTMYDLFMDKNKNLWVFNEDGITFFEIKNNKTTLLNVSDGLVETSFSRRAVLQLSTNEILIGGRGGFNIFQPENFKINDYPSKVSLRSLSVKNKTIHVENSDSIIQLLHDQNDLSIEYIGVLLSSPNEVRYGYQLINYDDTFNIVGNQRFARYTNLTPGTYSFQVRATNRSGVWQEPKTLFWIKIHPPWWKTWWFYALTTLFAIIGFIAVRKYEIKRIILANELKFKRKEAERLKELDQTKSNFFANISHEFRTPLTVILGQLELVMEHVEKSSRKGLTIALLQSKKLLSLVNQLLDLSKLESGGIKLNGVPKNIIPFLKNQMYSLDSLAVQKGIKLNFHSDYTHCILKYDEDLIGKILTNLLHNAIKFTPEKGEIHINVTNSSSHKDHVQIVVSDSGRGIPPNQLEKIFDRFYQVEDSASRTYEGTGIGLALVHELVLLHHGKIHAESDGHTGAKFILQLPAISMQTGEEDIYTEEATVTMVYDQENEAKVEKPGNDQPIILLVEDNLDVREYIRQCLQDDYCILEADNGLEGLTKAYEAIPDLIISDVMMPKMDGMEFSINIKENERTSHIPIIMLTARAGEQDKIRGLKTGVDDFLIKPFNKEELLVRISNLLTNREKLKKRYAQSKIFPLKDVEAESVDHVFLQKVFQFIEDHMDDEQLNVDKLAQSVAMSESQLNRKLNAILGQPPGQLIRSARLQKASELLSRNAGSVSEIAFQCGFSDVASFTRSFKKVFNVAPSRYSKPN